MAVSGSSTGLARIWRALFYSWDGICTAWKHEAAFRQETILIALALPPGLWVAANNVERALLSATLLLVPIVELLNSAIEAAIDRISQEHHALSKRAKDLGSAAVFLALLNAAIVWGFVLLPKFHS